MPVARLQSVNMIPAIPAFAVPGGPELFIILAIAVLLFGANKLPELARSSGQAMGEFKRGRQELEAELTAGLEDGDDSVEFEPDADAE